MHVTIYLKIMGALFILAVGLPLLIAPLRWARLMRWHLPGHADLTNYFGRCLGAVVTSISALYLGYADSPHLQPFMLELLIAAFGLMVLVHVWGFIRRTQPWTETAEIPLYLALSVYAGLLRFSA